MQIASWIILRPYYFFETLFFKATDARVYALMRILYSSVCLISLAHLWTMAPELLTDSGIIPSEAFKQQNGAFSVFYLVTDQFGVNCLFFVAAIALICMLLGYQTRIAAILVFIWQFSYAARIIGSSGWDYLLLNIGFALMLSPLDNVWSIRSIKARKKGISLAKTVPRYGLILIQLEVALMYFQTVWYKIGDPFWRNGELVSYFVMGTYSIIQKPLLIDFPRVGVFLTHMTIIIQHYLPFLLWNKKLRLIGFISGCAMHFAILFSTVPIFSLVVFMSYWAFVSGEDLDRIKDFFQRYGPKIYLNRTKA
tara:strand:+ start:897 stop:1823 length:927 start_codon:yes stop_codon:yes gene_type:complete